MTSDTSSVPLRVANKMSDLWPKVPLNIDSAMLSPTNETQFWFFKGNFVYEVLVGGSIDLKIFTFQGLIGCPDEFYRRHAKKLGISSLAEFVQYRLKFVPIGPATTTRSTSTMAPVIIETSTNNTADSKTTTPQSTASSTTSPSMATEPAAGSGRYSTLIVVLLAIFLFLLLVTIVIAVIFYTCSKKKTTVDDFINFHSNADSKTAEPTTVEVLFEKSASTNEEATKEFITTEMPQQQSNF